ncbi:hypothetical protein JD844_010556 [Phrynosoma platyrhinos]|uniref:F-box associated domain-containing protein n=1 Tax=Phrynosoma platyrhinos TaxID=52577 RepID=A0ABQ7TH18_PHRPL|nr:hypothetical protein JD844_010556 [Phrynosoma platyrhinos]
MALFPNVSKGLGQLEAYIEAEEGVAFQTDSGQFWASLTNQHERSVVWIYPKKSSCKFTVTYLSSGKVTLKDWRGMYLAVVEDGEEPSNFPVLPTHYVEDESFHFAVFHSGNKVAFRAYNGLFLSRVLRQFYVLEAAKVFTDDSCLFQPVIGDLFPPTMEILDVVPTDLSRLKFHRHLVATKAYVNRTKLPVRHTFIMTWNTRCLDKIIWEHLWGLGVPSLCPFTVERVMPLVMYTRDNERLIHVEREISEKVTKEVEVPPETRAVAFLFIHGKYNAPLPFTAIIRKKKRDGTEAIFDENGAWMGLVYQDLWVECSYVKLRESCTTM